MNTTEAIRILEALIDGVDPLKGEVLPEASPYNEPAVIRALAKAHATMVRAQHVYKEQRKLNLPSNAGKPWSKEDDRQLIEEFDGGLPVKDMATKPARTELSITSRLVRLGKIPERFEAYVRPPFSPKG